MADFLVPHGALVLVGDGRKALFLRNDGQLDRPSLTVVRVLTHENPPTSEQGSAPPGRAFSSSGAGRSAYEQADWHELEEHRFAEEIVRGLTSLAGAGDLHAVVLIAPPKVLGDLRAAMPKALRGLIVGELSKDLTKHPVDQIERLLAE